MGIPPEVQLHLTMNRVAMAYWHVFSDLKDGEGLEMGESLLRGIQSDAKDCLLRIVDPPETSGPDSRFIYPLSYMAVSMARIVMAIWGIYDEAATSALEEEKAEAAGSYRQVADSLIKDLEVLLTVIWDFGLDETAMGMATSWGPVVEADLVGFLEKNPSPEVPKE